MSENTKVIKKKNIQKNQKKFEPKEMMAKAWKFMKSKRFGMIMSLLQLELTIILLGMILYLNILPLRFFIPLNFILLLFVGVTFLSAQSKKFRYVGRIFAGLFSIVYIFGMYYIGQATSMFDSVAGAEKKVDIINVYVLKDDKAQNISDIKEYNIGILEAFDREKTDETIDEIKDNVGGNIAIQEFESWTTLVDALYDGTVGAIILNSAYVPSISEMEGYSSFERDVRVIFGYIIESAIETPKEVDVTNDTFAMYISGIDTYGSISTTSRSDVNILAVVNPTTRQVLLINTPRDYYVKLGLDGKPMDKLTHAGMYGVDVSMNTLEILYGIDVNYFFRVNFSGFEKVIDALGGVTVNSEYSFTTSDGKYYIKKGTNTLNGAQALGYCRERHAFATGDRQRGKNQMEVIKAIVNTMASTAILNDFSGLMESLEGSFETSMTSAQISALVRMQLAEGGSWNVVNYSADGAGRNEYSYSLGMTTYMMIPDETTVDKAKELIKQVYDGKVISVE